MDTQDTEANAEKVQTLTALRAVLPGSTEQIKRVLEAVLLSAQQPLSVQELRRVFVEEIGGDVLRTLLMELRADWAERSLELIQVASGWRFRTRAEFLPYLERLHPEKPAKYSRAVLETRGDTGGRALGRCPRQRSSGGRALVV